MRASLGRLPQKGVFACTMGSRLLTLPEMQINYPQAKTLCTEVEFQILASAKPQVLAAMKPAELRSIASKARKYSDKWLAQSRKQGNSTDGAGARSFTKHEFFKEAVARAEAKLAKLEAVKPVVKKVAKKAAAVKKTGVVKKVASAKKAIAKKTVTPTAPAKKAASKKAKKAAAKKVAKKAVSSRARSDMSLANQAKQKSIGTGLRMATSGQSSRVRGHVSAQGRRNQAARSARKR